jgi:putative flippase GtrA
MNPGNKPAFRASSHADMTSIWYPFSVPKHFRHPLVRRHLPQLLKFAVAGGLGATIDLGTLTLLVERFGFPEQYAIVPSTLSAVAVVFTINKFFTFKNRQRNVGGQLLKFALVYGVAILSNIAISAGLIAVGVHYLLSKVVAIGVGALWNYAMSHGYVFKVKRGEEVDAVVV